MPAQYPYQYDMELRNVPRFRVMEYLIEAGGTPTNETAVQAETWHAYLEAMPPVQITVMSIRRDKLIIAGDDPDDVEEVYNFMRRKTMRGGG